jgi:CRISPR-associated endonuclease/helicase Cas3
MSVLFERLLAWLGQLGTSVVILSATLPNATRERFVRAYAGAKAIPNARYPRLTVAPQQGEVNTLELTPPKSKTLAYTWVERDENAIVTMLRERLAQGGCAAVICNTIWRAQKVYKAIQAAGLIDPAREDEGLVLFHVRFPMAWREEIENDVLGRFGPNTADKREPNPKRLRKAIVVATQVIEQSLDLDFDVMISDHAPVDLLLQRAGRLHRHEVNEKGRRHAYELMICAPSVNDGVPNFDRADKLVYDEFILLRSWLALQGRSSPLVRLPDDMSELIEQVYGNVLPQPDNDQLQKALADAEAASTRDEGKERFKARQRLIPLPDQNVLHADNLELDEDDPRVHQTFQALTRSDKPGTSVVCLHRINGALYTDLKGNSAVYDSSRRPNAAMARELERHSVAIRRPDLEAALLATPADEDAQRLLKRWKKVAALRHHRVLIFEEGQCDLPGTHYRLMLSKEFGLEIVKRSDL